MRRVLPLIAVVFALATGCTTTPSRVDTGPLRAGTFNFIHNGVVKPADFVEQNKAIHASVQDAITANLNGRGLTRVDGDSDYIVAYLILIGNNTTTTSINDYFGYGRDDYELQEKAHKASAIDNKNPNYYEAGALVIDILDSTSYKLLRRSYVVRPIQADTPPDVRQTRIRDAVDEALSDLKVRQ